MNTISSVTKFHKTALRSALIVAGLITGIGLGTTQSVFADQAMPKAHSDGLGAVITDTTITAKVKAKLMGEEGLGKSDINVTTTNGVVTLEGVAVSDKAKALAETQTTSIDGVKSVDNNLSTPGGSKAVAKTKRVVSDSWITTKVKSELLAESPAKGFEVSVVTKDGVVILSGTLASQDAVSKVKNIAANIEGVKSVDTSALTVEGMAAK